MMPLQPIIYGILRGNLYLIKMLDICVSTASIYLVYLIGKEVFSNERIGKISMVICSIYPSFIWYTTKVLTEPIYLFLMLTCFFLMYKKKIFLGCCVLVLIILQRPAIDILSPILVIFFSFFVHNFSLRKTIKYSLIYLGIYILMMSPWWIHQYIKYGEFVRLNLGDGLVLYTGNVLGNGKDNTERIKRYYEPFIDKEFGHIEAWKDKNQAMKKDSYLYIYNNFDEFLMLIPYKMSRFWSLFPYDSRFDKVKYVYVVSYGTILLLFIAGVYLLFSSNKKRILFKKLVPVFLFFIYTVAVHSVTYSNIRYRLPLEPFMIIIASYAVVYCLDRISNSSIQTLVEKN